MTSRVRATFTSPGRDIYLFTLAAKTLRSEINYTIAGLEPPMGLTHTSPTMYDETSSRQVMSALGKGQTLNIQYKGDPNCCSSNWWGGFSVSGYMDPLVSFSVASSTSMTSRGLVTFDTEIVNTGQFNTNTSSFVTPLNGIYYFSISAGLFARTTVELILKVNGNDVYVLFHKSNTHIGIKTISGSTLLDLQAGDLVTLHLTQGQMYSSPEQHEVSFMCFLYSPKQGTSVEWMVSKTDNNSDVRPVRYNKVHIKKGVKYQGFNGIEVLVSGIYYIYYSFIVPAPYNYMMEAHVSIAGDCKETYIYHSVQKKNDLETVSGSIIYKLQAHQILMISTNLDRIMESSNVFRSTSFMGFLITETKD